MKFEYLKDIPQLEGLYSRLSNANVDSEPPYMRCIKYGRDLEKLVRYTYSKKFQNEKAESSELVKLLKNKEFRGLLGTSELYSKSYFIYLAGSNASFDHEIDAETADLAFENLKEVTYVIFSKSNLENNLSSILYFCAFL